MERTVEDHRDDAVANLAVDRLGAPRTGRPVDLLFLSRNPDEHHQIVLISGRPESLSFNVINQISLRVDSLATLKAMHARVAQEKTSEIAPVTHGNSLSI